jgi:hypothetical protein
VLGDIELALGLQKKDDDDVDGLDVRWAFFVCHFQYFVLSLTLFLFLLLPTTNINANIHALTHGVAGGAAPDRLKLRKPALRAAAGCARLEGVRGH